MDDEPRLRASVEQVAASGHPVRRRLLEVLGVEGPATASQLAERTGQLVGNVSHHLKMLARAGMVEEAAELAKDRRERWWRHVPLSLSWSLADVRGDPVGEAVAVAAEYEHLEHHLRRVRGWLAARDGSDDYDEAWTRAAFATDSWVWATPEELDELGEAINAARGRVPRVPPRAGTGAGELLRLRPRRSEQAVTALREAPPFRRDRLVQAWSVVSGVSLAGDAAWFVAFAWTAATIADPATAGLMLGAGTIPRAVTALYGGALADRYDARRVVVLANAGRIAVLVAGTAFATVGGIGVPLLLTVAITFGVLDAIHNPAAMTLPRTLVRVDDLPAAAGLMQVAGRLARFGGAPLGGVLVAVGGLRLVMVVDAVTFAVVAAFVGLALKPRYPRALSSTGSVRQDLVAAAAYLKETPYVRALVVSLSGLNLFVGPALAVGVTLHVHRSGWGAADRGCRRRAGRCGRRGRRAVRDAVPLEPAGSHRAAHAGRSGGRHRADRGVQPAGAPRRHHRDRRDGRARLDPALGCLPAARGSRLPRPDGCGHLAG